MMKSKKHYLFILVILALTLVSCNSKDYTPRIVKTPVYFTIEASGIDEEGFVKSSSSVTFTVDETSFPSGLEASSIKWCVSYISGDVTVGRGASFTFTPDNENANANLLYRIHAVIDSNKYEGSSDNTITFIALKDDSERYRAYAKQIYTYLVNPDNEYIFQPGLSVSVYGKDKNNKLVQFDLFDGLAQLNNRVRNTADTQHLLGSISKSFVAASVVSLVGSAGLEKTLEYYQTELGDNKLDLSFAPQGTIDTSVPIKKILTHTAGIGDFISADLIMDLCCYKPSLISALLLGHSYKFSNWKPEQILHYIIPNTATVDHTKYSSPGIVIMGMLAEKLSGQSLNVFLHNNFFNSTLGTSGMLLAPQDSVDYAKLSHQHEFKSGIYKVIEDETDIKREDAEFIVELLISKDLTDFTDIIPDVNLLYAQTSWCAGSIIGTSNNVAQWGFNLLCKTATDSNLTAVKVKTGEPAVDVHSIIRDSALNLASGKYGYGIQKISNHEQPFLGHRGRTAGSYNIMAYNDETNMCYAVFVDANEASECIDPDDIVFDLYTIDKGFLDS